MAYQQSSGTGVPTPIKRPFSVTLLVVFTWISAILNLAAGAFVLIASFTGDVDPDGATGLRIMALILLVAGLITALIASKLAGGSNGARILLTILEILTIASSIGAIAQGGNTAQQTGAVPSLIIAFIVLALLWNSKATAFFKQPKR